MERRCTNQYNCSCRECQHRNGNLALLVTGIESQTSTNPNLFSLNPIGTHNEDMPQVQQPFQHHQPLPTSSQAYSQQHNDPYAERSFQSFSQDYLSAPVQTYHPFTQSTSYQVDSEESPSTSSGYHGHIYCSCCQHQAYSANYTNLSETSSRASTLPSTLQEFEDTSSQIDSHSSGCNDLSGHTKSEEKLISGRPKRVCDDCGKHFGHTGDYKKHLRKHTKEKPYECRMCEKRFSHTSNLHRHERSHTGDRPYRCEFCDKEFNKKDKLDSHKKSKSCRNKRKDI